MASSMQLPVRKALENWCEGEVLEGTRLVSKDIGDSCFIWVEPVTQGNDELFPSYFARLSDLKEVLNKQPERQLNEVVISTPKHYLRLLIDTSNLLTATQQPCFVLHKELDEANPNTQPTEQKLYSQQELDKRFSQKAQEANPSLKKQRWVFIQQGSALFFDGEVKGEK